MKKLILFALTAVIMAGCTDANAYYSNKQKLVSDYRLATFEYQGCEYVVMQSNWKLHGTLTHKGNCRFCAERRKQELQSIVKQLNTLKWRSVAD